MDEFRVVERALGVTLGYVSIRGVYVVTGRGGTVYEKSRRKAFTLYRARVKEVPPQIVLRLVL